MGPDLDDGAINSLSALEVLLRRPAWHRDGLCREPAYRSLPWVPDNGQRTDACKVVCTRCLVRVECLAWALEHDNGRGGLQGVYGGLGRAERHEMQTGRQAA